MVKIIYKGCKFTNTKYCKCSGCYYERAGQINHVNKLCCCFTNIKILKLYCYRDTLYKISKLYPIKTKKDYMKTIRKRYIDKSRKYNRLIFN